MLFGFDGHHAFTHRPTFQRLKAECSRDELAQRLADPAIKAAILSEDDLPPDPNLLFDNMFALAQYALGRTYAMGDPPDYEPTDERTVEKIAAERGEDPLSTLYDLMLEHDATSMLMLPFYNYAYGNHDAIREMLTHPAGVVGLSDGGAHCGMICDASFPTFLLTHWARDRRRGEKLPLEYVIRKQSYDTAQLFGLSDRGVVEIGKRADVNVIDMDAITLHRPRMAYDLPAGGNRLMQGASGYDATIVNGVVTRRDGVDTGARPGRWVVERRGQRGRTFRKHGQLVAQLSRVGGACLVGQLGQCIGEAALEFANDFPDSRRGSGRLDGRIVEGAAPHRRAACHRGVENGQQLLTRRLVGRVGDESRDALLDGAQVCFHHRCFARKVLIKRAFGD
jgi:N-acyl-D-aspartate/D-glutamate deacylase